MHGAASRDSEDELATEQPQGLGSEAYLNCTSQGPRPEDARQEDHIHCRSRRFVHNAELDDSLDIRSKFPFCRKAHRYSYNGRNVDPVDIPY
jgi:hypothetical protein